MRLGTVTQAASVLGITQPAVSSMIAGLEREIGFALFQRQKGRLRPTPEAAFLMEDVERTLGSLDRTIQTARAIRGRSHGSLVIACYPAIAIDFLPKVLTEFMASRPGVRIELHSRSSHVLHELIPAQRFDIGVADLPVNQRGIQTEPLTFDCVCVLPATHPLARERVITPRHLDGEPFIALFNEHITHFRIANAFAAANAHWKVIAETRFFASCCAFVAYGAGVTIVDPITAAEFAPRGLVARRFAPAIPYEIGLLYPTERLRSGLVDDLAAMLKARIAPFAAKRSSASFAAPARKRRDRPPVATAAKPRA